MERKTRINGFTLTELLIVMAVVSIIMAIGYPTYVSQARKALRKQVVGEMVDLASSMERVKAQRFSYVSEDGRSLLLDNYELLVAVEDGVSYSITATPFGDQLNDQCGELSLTSDGVWGFAAGQTEEICIGSVVISR